MTPLLRSTHGLNKGSVTSSSLLASSDLSAQVDSWIKEEQCVKLGNALVDPSGQLILEAEKSLFASTHVLVWSTHSSYELHPTTF